MTSEELTDKRLSHFVGIGLTLGFILPHTSTVFLLVNPLLCLAYQFFKQNKVYYNMNWLVLIPLLTTLLFNLPQSISTKALMSAFTVMLYFACFPIVRNVKIPNGYFFFILGFVFVSQIAYAYDITFMEVILNTVYPISEEDVTAIHMQNTVNADNILNFRLGGLFHNSNDCSRALTFLLAGFVILNREKPFRYLLPFIIISFYAVLLTGSRTGYVVSSLIIISYIFVDKRISNLWRIVAVVSAVVAFGVMTWMGSDTYRGFNVVQGFSNSADLKMATFGYYLSSENSVLRLLIGYLDVQRFDISGATSYVMSQFDSDYGGIIFSYGFIGFVSILIYFFTIFLKLRSEGRVFFVLLLWMYSSTIVTSFRALFLFMLLLSVVYSNESKSKHLTQ